MNQSENDEQPQIGSKPIPTWVMVMWALGIIWVVLYVVQGLQSSPEVW